MRSFRLPKDLRNYIISIILGCALFAMPAILSAAVIFFASIPNADTFHVLARAAGLLPSPTLPVTLVRIDESTFKTWGRPFPMEKARIAELLEVVRPTKPAAILVDFDLSATTPTDDVSRLTKVLNEWTASDPPLLIPKRLDIGAFEVTMKPDFIDDYVGKDKPIYRVNLLFERGDDIKIRNWNLWETPKGACEALLSPQLLLFLLDSARQDDLKAIASHLADRDRLGNRPENCSPSTTGHDLSWVTGLHKNAAIDFVFGATDATHPAFGDVSFPNGVGPVPALTQWSAETFRDKKIIPEVFAGRYIIIGASHLASGDFHDTPAGEMEGMRIVANAIAISSVTLTVGLLATILAVDSFVELFKDFFPRKGWRSLLKDK